MYKLRKQPKHDLYWVVSADTGKHHSKDPMPLAKAKKQLIALNIAYARELGYKIPVKK
jgi:hypothetical protein